MGVVNRPGRWCDVVVVGAGVAGLVTARELALRGARVTVLEATAPGGCVAAHDVAGLTLDAGAEAFATRGGSVRALVDEVGLGADVVTPARSGGWVYLPAGGRGRSVPLPATGLMGIPGDPRAPDVRRAVGRLGAARAALDRHLPARIGLPDGPTTVAGLVRARMGRRVVDRLVSPVVGGVYSTWPEDADLDTVLPGIRGAVRETGSLAAAVASRRAAAPAGSAVAGIVGGMHRLVEALATELTDRGGVLKTGAVVEALTRGAAGRTPGRGDAGTAAEGPWRLALAGGGAVEARTIVVATPGATAVRLLGPLVPAVSALDRPSHDILLATLVLDAPALDAAPRGTGVLVARGVREVQAKALTHGTAKWAWLAEAAGPGRHVLRLSYGRGGERVPWADDDTLQARALADASALLGVPLAAGQVVGFARRRWAASASSARPGRREAVERFRKALGTTPGLHATGAWLAGTGVAAVVADARTLGAALPIDLPA